MTTYIGAEELRTRNLKIGDTILFTRPNGPTWPRDIQGLVMENGPGVYLGSQSTLGNEEIFNRFGYAQENWPSDTQPRYLLVRAILGIEGEGEMIGNWPRLRGSSSEEGLLHVWKIALALMEHMEGIRTLDTYYKP